MKTLLIIIATLISISSFGQKIDYNNFDNKLFEQTLFNYLNEKRVELGVEPLVWSNVLYNEATVRNMKIVIKTDAIFHPDFSKVWDSLRVRTLLSKESDKIIGGKCSVSTYAGPQITFYENIFKWTKRDITYQELSKFVIESWETSFFHKNIQYCSYISKNKPGMGSCTIGFPKNSNNMYIIFNFAMFFRTE